MKLQVKIENQTFDVEIEDLNSRPVVARVEGETFEIWPEETPLPAPAAAVPSAPKPAAASAPAATPPVRAAAAAAPVNTAKAVTSPLPGTVIAIMVREGDQVKYGQDLMTLEAMKMQNAIRANREGKIAVIHVNVGDQVRHGQPLIEYAD